MSPMMPSQFPTGTTKLVMVHKPDASKSVKPKKKVLVKKGGVSKTKPIDYQNTIGGYDNFGK